MIWALIFVVVVQSSNSLTPQIEETRSSGKPFTTASECEEAGMLKRGAIAEETNPDTQYVWQHYKCVELKIN